MYQIMTRERADEIRAEFAKATRKWSGQTFQHFASDEERERHLKEVKEAQEQGAPF